MYTQEQINQMVAVKQAEIEELVAQGIVPAELIQPTLDLYTNQLQQEGMGQAPAVVTGEQPQQVAQDDVPMTAAWASKLVNVVKQTKPQLTFEYKEITDLYLPALSAENKAKAIRLANDIELLRASINERTQRNVVVPDSEIESLKNMKKAFKKLTHTDFYTATTQLATKGLDTVATWSDALANDIESRSTQFITNLSDVACDAISQTGDLLTLGVGFTSNLAQGTVKLVSSTSNGILKAGLGIFKRR